MIQPLMLVPAHNEAKFISGVVNALKVLGHDVIVIDDGSIDDTAAQAKAAGAIVVSTGRKSGKGNALRQGFAYALKENVAAVITLDGDGQHAPSDIQAFIHKYELTKADVINGNRLENPKGMPLIRLLTNKFMSAIISCLCHQKVADTQCGFRLITRSVLEQVTLECADFEIETELLIQASKKGFRIDNVPIATIYGDEKSKIRPFRDTWRFIKYILNEFKRK